MLTQLSLGAIALVLWFVLRKCEDILATQEMMMAQIDDVAAANAAKVDALEAKVNETIVTLKELKELVGTGDTANAEAILAQTNEKLGVLLDSLGAAEAENDPTPDA